MRYRVLLWLAWPYVWVHLLWRGWRQRDYWQHVGERWGYDGQPITQPLIWLHAVSVGETRASVPVVKALHERYPQYQILLTHGTPTGRATGLALFGSEVLQSYLPYDYPAAVRRFILHYRPVIGLIMETEIWPNLLRMCRQQGVPVLLINARLSARSAKRYRWLGQEMAQALSVFCAIAAQSDADAQRLTALGGQRVSVMGNVKFDIDPPVAQIELGLQWRASAGAARQIWLAASTREGEEALVLEAWRAMQPHPALLVIVPRHPQRFEQVAQLIQAQGWRYQRRSSGQAVSADSQVWLGDSMGELFAYYRMSDVAVIGGSLLPFGGQNLIEAAAVGCPVIVGPHSWNFSEISQTAIACGAAVQVVAEPWALTTSVVTLLGDAGQRLRMQTAGVAFGQRYRGATQRVMPMIASCMGHVERTR